MQGTKFVAIATLLVEPINAFFPRFTPIRGFVDQHRLGLPKLMIGVKSQSGCAVSGNTQLYLAASDGGGGGGSGLSRRAVLQLLGAIAVSLPFIGELYSRLGGVNVHNIDFPQIPDTATEATMVFHGAGGPDQYTDALMNKLDAQGGFSSLLNWFQYCQNILQASFNGQVVGLELSRRILKDNPKLERIHLIGVSVGAFVADSVVAELKAKKPELYVQQTLLDPFCGRGVLDPGYGKRRFGAAADYAQQYLNTDDPVPNTNEPLPNCVVYDVTSIRPQDIFGHDWPLVYYGKSAKVGFVPNSQKRERGVVIEVKE